MRCLECQDLLQRQLDGDAWSLNPELDEHLGQCPACRALHKSAQLLVRGLDVLRAPEVPFGFAHRMTAAVLEERRVRKRRVRQRLYVTAALAASVLIMAVAGYFVLPPRGGDGKGVVVKIMQPNAVASGKPAGGSTERAREQARILFSMGDPREVPDIDKLPDLSEPLDLEPAAQSLMLAGQGVAEGLEPVALSARRALAYFYRELPLVRTP